MEKRKLQRIIGILVVIAVVIILIPLFFGKKEVSPQQVTTLTAPPFPEQQSSPAVAPQASEGTVAQNTPETSPPNTVTLDAQDNGITPVASVESNTQNTATPANPADTNNTPAQDNGITPIAAGESNTQNAATPANPADTNNVLTPPPAQSTQNTSTIAPANVTGSSQQPSTPDSYPNGNTAEAIDSNPAQSTEKMTPTAATAGNDTVPQAEVEKMAVINTAAKEVKPHRTRTSLIAKKASHFSEKDLANLKKPAWVVQMGSFKEKSNAHRLVDQLRTAGFKAFTHEVTSSAGITRTRVYIGPEFKEASALKLSTQVEQIIKLRGFVVPYKPLAL